jgi:hypothetical protein
MLSQYHKLPTTLYKVRVPLISTYTEEEIELFGIPQDEYNGKAKDASEAMTTVMINLDKMIDIYSMGYPIQLVVQDNVGEIYSSLEKYLLGTIDEENFSLNRATETDPRMDEIDKFAQEMFGINKITIVKKTINARNGFDLGMSLMNAGFGNKQPHTPTAAPTGILAAYTDNTLKPVQQETQQRTYGNIFNSAPEIDISKVTRKSPRQRRKGISMKDYE